MSPIATVRKSIDLAAAVLATTAVLGFITVTSGPVLAFRFGPGI